PQAGFTDYSGKSVKNKVVVFLGTIPPKGTDARQLGRAMFGRGRNATEQEGAVASIGPVFNFRGPGAQGQPQAPQAQVQGGAPAQPQTGEQGQRGPGGAVPDGDFTTVQRLDGATPPNVTAQDEFFEFLFNGADVKYADLKAKIASGEKLPAFALKNVKMT